MRISEVMKGLEQTRIEHGDLEVFTEGCDCDGDVGLIVVEELSQDRKYVTLARSDGEYARGWRG